MLTDINFNHPREQIIERINKLLAHSVENGATEAEAVAFALKAQKLIADNDIEDWELGGEIKRQEVKRIVTEGHYSRTWRGSLALAVAFALKAQKLIADNDIEDWELGEEVNRQEVKRIVTEGHYTRTWRGALSLAVADNFRCKALIQYERSKSGRKREAHILFVGYENDARAAALVFDHLYKVGDKLAKAHKKECYGDPYAYDNFVYGFTNGIREELEKQCQALMLVCPQEVEDHYNSIQCGVEPRPRRYVGNEDSQEKGRIAGRDAVRSRRIEKQESFLLTA